MVLQFLLNVLLLGLQRADSNTFSLRNKTSACDGLLQFNHFGEWRDVVFPEFILKTISSICYSLSCGAIVSGKFTKGRFWSVEMNPLCVQSVYPFEECVHSDNVSSAIQYDLTCSDSVRLVYGSHQCTGSLEVKRNQVWTRVCEEGFDLTDAEVACRELGCGGPSVLKGKIFEGLTLETPMYQCEGHEDALKDCPRSDLIQTCPSSKVVVLTCSEPLRLVGESSVCAGTVELKHRGEWRPVYVADFMNEKVAAEVCSHLDCGAPLSHEPFPFYQIKPVWHLSPQCLKGSHLLRECIDLNGISATGSLKVKCSGKFNRFLLLWLIPGVTIIVIAIVLAVYKSKKCTLNAQDAARNGQQFNRECVSVSEEHIYQSLGPDSMDQHYLELHPELCTIRM